MVILAGGGDTQMRKFQGVITWLSMQSMYKIMPLVVVLAQEKMRLRLYFPYMPIEIKICRR